MSLFFFRKNSIKFYERIYVYMKQNNHGNAKKQCIIHYDNITVKEPLKSLSEVTLKSLKENREIVKVDCENYHYQKTLQKKVTTDNLLCDLLSRPPSQGQMQSHCDL